MRILVCTTKPAEAKRLKALTERFAKKLHRVIEIQAFSSPIDAAASKIKFDIAVIEAGMDAIDGATLGRIFLKTTPYIKLIYLADTAEQLDSSFDLNAVRYFMRPLTAERFYNGLTEALRRLDREQLRFSIQPGGEKVIVARDSILYIEIENRRTKVVTAQGTYLSANSLTYWREHLHSLKFFSPHKSYIVNMAAVEKYRRNEYFTMKNGDTVSISRARGADVHAQFNAYQALMQ